MSAPYDAMVYHRGVIVESPARVAALDVDGTMLPGSLGLRLLRRVRELGLGAPGAGASIDSIFAAIERHRGGAMTYAEMVPVTTRAYGVAIRGIAAARLESLAVEVWGELRAEIFEYVRPMVARVSEAGLRPVVISSSPQEIVDVLAADLGIADAVGSRFCVESGAYTGECARMPGLPGGKVAALAAAAGERVDWAASMALGNAPSDACLLEQVGIALAFEPVAELRALAEARGWTICDRGSILAVLDRRLGRAGVG